MACLGGCDLLFGIQPLDPQKIDAPAGTTTEISELSFAEPIAVNEQAEVSAKVHGPPGASVVCTFAATAGGFSPLMVLVLLDPNGDGQAMTTFTAPTTAGDVTIQGTAETSSTSRVVAVQPLVTFGADSMLAGAPNQVADFIVGTRFQLTGPVTLRDIGVWISMLNATTKVRLAIYTDSGGPTTRLFELPPQTVALGRNAYRTMPTTITPGTYWVVGIFDHQVNIFAENTATVQGWVATPATPFANGAPPTAPVGTLYMIRYSYFVSVIP
jgi:hypothetical protein